ncbi:MAG: sulfur oxidation c-type cytochrome SoxX [Burkholderiaceae bacterium]
MRFAGTGCAAAVALLALVACAQAPAPSPSPSPSPKLAPPPGDHAAFPCLGRTLPCGRIATRRPVAKSLDGPLAGDAERGRRIAHARDKGNCLACHAMQGGTQPGTRGPDLTRYGSTGRSDADIYAAVYDMRTRHADTLMPPFGTNEILRDQEIRDVVAYLQASR